jgi:uncharacterized protein involved in high-affinity Fe2+ transport
MAQPGQQQRPPMVPRAEAEPETLEMARAQGRAMARALRHMTEEEATCGAEQEAGDYRIAYAVEQAEGMYERGRDGALSWVEPTTENVHVEVAVCDRADGRFLPGLTVHATLIDPQGNEVGTHRQPFLWHPWLYHYGRNWTVPGDGGYTLRVQVEAPDYPRHDRKNGLRYEEGAEVTFTNVRIRTGQKKS